MSERFRQMFNLQGMIAKREINKVSRQTKEYIRSHQMFPARLDLLSTWRHQVIGRTGKRSAKVGQKAGEGNVRYVQPYKPSRDSFHPSRDPKLIYIDPTF